MVWTLLSYDSGSGVVAALLLRVCLSLFNPTPEYIVIMLLQMEGVDHDSIADEYALSMIGLEQHKKAYLD